MNYKCAPWWLMEVLQVAQPVCHENLEQIKNKETFFTFSNKTFYRKCMTFTSNETAANF